MSAVKHAPATPLPWYFAPLSGVVRQVEYDGPKRVCSVHYREDAERDGDYLAHAANSYPKLVEYVRGVRGPVGAALLRELGEDS